MRNSLEYKKIAENAIEEIRREPNNGKVKHPEKYISAELCEKLEHTVEKFIPLILFKKNHELSRTVYILYLQYVLPELVSQDTLCSYFLKLLVEGHNELASWSQCDKKRDFKRILGLTYSFHTDEDKDCRYHWVMRGFKTAFEELFTFDLRYPQDLIKEVDRCFCEKIPMPHTYKMFTELYLGRRDVPYLNFIAHVVYLRHDDKSVAEYADTVIKKYISEFGAYHEGQANLLDMMVYVFGGRFARTIFEMSKYTRKYKDFHTPIFKFKTTFLRTAWPYVYRNYVPCRDQAYEMMRLTKEEKEAYEQKFFGKPVRRLRASKAKVIVDPDNLELPHGTTYAEIRSAVKRYYMLSVLPQRIIPPRSTALAEIVQVAPQNTALVKDLKHIRSHSSLAPILTSLMEDEENRLREKFIEGNSEEIHTDKDVLCIYYFHKGRYQSRKIDYSVISSPDFRREARVYCREILGKKISPGNVAKVKKCIRFCADMVQEYRIRRCKDVTRGYICIWLHKKQLQGIKPTTITEDLSVICGFLDTIMACKSYALRPEQNAARRLRFYGARDHIKSRPVIPDDILIFIEDHLWELDEEWRLLFRILRQTSWRFDDATNVRVDGIYDIGDTEYFGIRTVISKTLKQRRRSGLGDYIEDVITADLYQDLQEYISGTDIVRQKYDADYIFFSCSGGMAHQEDSHTFSDAVNDLLTRHGIRSIDSTYLSFSSSQTRATGATELIEAGVDLPIVQHKLGHLHPETTAKHYAHVRERRRGELDKEFFERKFSDLFDPEKLALLTEKERTAIYENFVSKHRKVEFGSCKKEPCGGTCLRHGSTECVECTKLLTGPQNLFAWQTCLEDSERRVKEMVAAYDARGIMPDIYADFKEYKEAVRRRNDFRDVIAKITSWKEERE